MAKFQGILGGRATGKVGNLVFTQVAGVGTVAREYVANPRNPKTEAQQSQRTKLSNLVNFYRAFNGILKGAFETKKASQSDYNAFVQKNLASNPIALAKHEAEAGAIVVAPYRISEGSLTPITASTTSFSGGTVVIASSIVMTEDYDVDGKTVGEVSQEILSNNPNLRNGMQISLVTFVQSVAGVPAVPRAAVQAREFTIEVGSAQLFSETEFANVLRTDEGAFAARISGNPVAYAWILSERVNGKLAVSTQSIVMLSETTYDAYNTDAQRMLAAQSYGESSDVFLAPGGGGQAVPDVQPEQPDNGGDDGEEPGGGNPGLE